MTGAAFAMLTLMLGCALFIAVFVYVLWRLNK